MCSSDLLFPGVAETPSRLLWQKTRRLRITGKRPDLKRCLAICILREILSGFFFWLDSQKVVPTIIKMRRQAEFIKQSEVDKALRRIEDITPRERRIVEQLAHSIINRWLHKPICNMKTLAGVKANSIDCYINAINDLFELEDEEGNNG